MRVHDGLNDGEAQACTSAAARRIATTEALKDGLSQMFPTPGPSSVIGC